MTGNHCHNRVCQICLLVVVAIAGCGRSGTVDRYEWTGKIWYQGKLVPAGRIMFAPDNGGPAGMADIKEGEYVTRPGKGLVGGPHVVTIFGEDGTMASESHNNALFPPFEIKFDFPMEDGVKDFDVPVHK